MTRRRRRRMMFYLAALSGGIGLGVIGRLTYHALTRPEPEPTPTLAPIYSRGLSGIDYYEGEINPAIAEFAERTGFLGYDVQWHLWNRDRLANALEYGAELNLTWSPYHLTYPESHHPIDNPEGFTNFVGWGNEVLPMVAAQVPNPPAIFLDSENLTLEDNPKKYHDAAYLMAKRYFPDTPVIFYGPFWASKFDPEMRTDAVSARMYWPWEPARSERDYQAAVDEAQARGLKVVAWVSLGAGYVDDGVSFWNWTDPYDYDVELSRQQGEFLAAQTDTLFAIQLYPAPKDEEVWMRHWRAFAEGYYGAETK